MCFETYLNDPDYILYNWAQIPEFDGHIIKSPVAVLKDPAGTTNALMHYGQFWKNGKLFNVEILYDKVSNTIMHFKYDTRALGPLPKVK